MSDSTLTSVQTSPAPRARRGAAAVIAQYIQDLSQVQATITQSAAATGVPCAA